MNKKILITFILALININLFAIDQNVDQELKTGFLRRTIVEQIAKLKVDLDIPLLGAEIVDGINISTNYNYELYPSFMDNMYTRVDGWEFDVDVKPGDLVKSEMSSPFGFGISRGSKVLFVRHFEKQTDALTARPYGLGKIPLNARIVRDELRPGDMVSMPADLTLSMGASISNVSGIEDLFSKTSARVGIYLSGKFIVQVMRLKDEKVRLRLITEATRGVNAGVSSRIGAEFFGIEFVDNKINRFHPLALVEANYGLERGKQFILDYILDLKSNSARRAYNNIVNSRKRFKDVVAARAMIQQGQIVDEKIATTALADYIFSQDREQIKRNVRKEYRIQRLFKGLNTYRRQQAGLRINLLFIEHEGQTSFTKNNIVRINGNNEEQEYLYQIKRSFRERSRGVGYRSFVMRNENTMFSLLEKEKASSKEEYPDFGISVNKRESVFKPAEQKSFYRSLAKTIPVGLFSKIDFDYENSYERILNASVKYKLILKGEFFKRIPILHETGWRNRNAVFNNYKDYIRDLNRRNLLFSEEEKAIPQSQSDVKFFNTLYNVIYNKSWTAEKRQRKLMRLRNNSDFRELGIGFMLYLVPYTEMLSTIVFEFSQSADDLGPIEIAEGDLSINGIYNQIYSIQQSLGDRSYDLRIAE